MKNELVVVAGGGGFIGGHLIADLRKRGYSNLRSVDIRPVSEWHQHFDDVDNLVLDLKGAQNCKIACSGAVEIYNLAADMGGMGFIENNKALCMLSVLINTHMLQAAAEAGADRYFYSSSACVYNAEKQLDENVVPLKEEDAYPAMPEDGYGWEKIFSERMCRHFREDFGLTTRVARFHNVYGPYGTWEGGREKAPAAIIRKVLSAKLNAEQEIEIWGDGNQTRSFMYIDDCIKGIRLIMRSDIEEPINLGSNELTTINGLADIAAEIDKVNLTYRHNLDAPKGVNGRNSDNALIKKYLDWEPSITLLEGMEKTYRWIEAEFLGKYSSSSPEKSPKLQEHPESIKKMAY